MAKNAILTRGSGFSCFAAAVAARPMPSLRSVGTREKRNALGSAKDAKNANNSIGWATVGFRRALPILLLARLRAFLCALGVLCGPPAFSIFRTRDSGRVTRISVAATWSRIGPSGLARLHISLHTHEKRASREARPWIHSWRSVADVLVHAGHPLGVIDERIAIALEGLDHVVAQYFGGVDRILLVPVEQGAEPAHVGH